MTTLFLLCIPWMFAPSTYTDAEPQKPAPAYVGDRPAYIWTRSVNQVGRSRDEIRVTNHRSRVDRNP